jgi:hypothetical protein
MGLTGVVKACTGLWEKGERAFCVQRLHFDRVWMCGNWYGDIAPCTDSSVPTFSMLAIHKGLLCALKQIRPWAGCASQFSSRRRQRLAKDLRQNHGRIAPIDSKCRESQVIPASRNTQLPMICSVPPSLGFQVALFLLRHVSVEARHVKLLGHARDELSGALGHSLVRSVLISSCSSFIQPR